MFSLLDVADVDGGLGAGEGGGKEDTIDLKTTLLPTSSVSPLLYPVYLRAELLWGSAGHCDSAWL